MTDPTAPEAPEAPEEQGTPTESPAADEQVINDPQSPAEALAAEEEERGEEVVRTAIMETPAGSLTIRPNQKTLDAEQHHALLAIGIDTKGDPAVIPHVRAFVHMCQIRGLDPFAREAYLIGRGKGENRKFTMQTGIDGYRKMAKATGRFLRVKKVVWTGSDDDDKSFVRVQDDDGDYVMQRIWFDQWPAGRGHPGAAKVVIEHLDDSGRVTTTSAVADWDMYAPYKDVWEGSRGQRAVKRDADGKPVRELNEMWQKGGPHMLAKCAEALAHRKAFPAAMSGIYVTEEMHRLDQQDRNATNAAQVTQRQQAFEQRKGRPSQAAAARGEAHAQQQDAPAGPGEEGAEPTHIGDAVADVMDAVLVDDADATELLHAEFVWQAEAMGQSTHALATRRVKVLRKNLEDFTGDDLFPLVNGLRSMAAQAAVKSGVPGAARYADLAKDGAPPVDVSSLDDEEPATEEAPEKAPEKDTDSPHVFVANDEDDKCWNCGLAEGVGPHIEMNGDTDA